MNKSREELVGVIQDELENWYSGCHHSCAKAIADRVLEEQGKEDKHDDNGCTCSICTKFRNVTEVKCDCKKKWVEIEPLRIPNNYALGVIDSKIINKLAEVIERVNEMGRGK